jgi:hypothetical protein
MRLIDADKLKQRCVSCWNDENKELFDIIVDAQPTVEKRETTGRWSMTVNELFEHFSCVFDVVNYYNETTNVGDTVRWDSGTDYDDFLAEYEEYNVVS